MKIRLWLTVIRPRPASISVHEGTVELYWREIETGAIPGGDDRVVICPPEDPSDGEHGGPFLGVRVRYLGPSGKWQIELQRIVVDPPEKIRQAIMTGLAYGDSDHDIWWTETDGDPTPGLLEAGWVRYHGGDLA